MELYKAIEYAICQEGLGIISESRFVNYLADLQAFDSPAIKRILHTMCDGGYWKTLKSYISENNYDLHIKKIETALVKEEGFQGELVKYVLDCLLFATHKTDLEPALASMGDTPPPKDKSKKTCLNRTKMKIIKENENYIAEINGQSYLLDESQFKAIDRKKDMPIDRLVVWLQSYNEENFIV